MSPGWTCVARGLKPRGGCVACATIRSAPTKSTRHWRTQRHGAECRTELRSTGRHRRALHFARHAPGGGDIARAGRQQPGGDCRVPGSRRLRAARRAHDGSAVRARIAEGLQGARGLRRILLWRRAGRRRGLGEIDPVPCAGARGIRALLRAQRHLRARHLQRLPDVRRAQGVDARHGALAAFRAQSQRAVRIAASHGGDSALASVVLEGMAGSFLPIAVAHGEGRAEFASDAAAKRSRSGDLVAFRYVNPTARSRRPIRTTPTARRSPSPRSATPTAASPPRCRTPSARRATCRIPGARMAQGSGAAGCACSGTRGGSSASGSCRGWAGSRAAGRDSSKCW